MKKFTLDDFSQMIDHTNLHADANNADMKKLKSITSKWLRSIRFNQNAVQNI